MTAPLLEQSMALFKAECPGIFERVENYTRTAFALGDSDPDFTKIDFSNLCTFLDYIELRESGGREQWSDNGSRERLALKHYLAKTVIANTPQPDDIPRLYRTFAAQLGNSDVVITFNWDGLLENAMIAANRAYSYAGGYECAWVCKMHGSVHWRIGNRPGIFPARLPWRPVEFLGVGESGLYSSDGLLRIEGWHGAHPIGGEAEPFLVLPGYGKAKDVQHVRWLWYKPEGYFTLAEHVYIIGLSIAPDDFFVRSFLLHALSDWQGLITVINPDESVRAACHFLPSAKTSFRIEKFDLGHVLEMSS